ncbi:MAG: bifunctional phosphoribosylaminoimidazolecarboxamide formyltransferase/IMP cyclohydrolase [Planctomycetes bacterium]|nr:bifunctional phosphoribosylaminoimidazolecarboxamide formyltransferase/IMP cyclohydrolase [Planctomycetota bacterium]
MTFRTIRRALLSVSDKTGLVELARSLIGFGVELISTGGTRKALADAGLSVRDVSEVTGFPEILDGRVKTLHPRVHAGILAVRDNPKHQAVLKEHEIAPIDLVVCNLYPFEATLAKPGSTHEDIVENIDVGGPSMVRAAAKNYHDVAIVTDPKQYDDVVFEMRTNKGSLSLATREKLAAAAFTRTAAYDQAIAAYMAKRIGNGAEFPATLSLSFQKKQALRYGENPHQKAAFYVEPGLIYACVASAEVLHGKELSYNNILDLDSALNLVRELHEPAAVCIKHNNPCGAATEASLAEAFARAYEGDPQSAFGGILGFNREVDEATATRITEPNRFIECIIAPGYSQAAYQLLTTRPTWKKNVRILKSGKLTGVPPHSLGLRQVDGGLLVQSRDVGTDDFKEAKVVTQRNPTPNEMADLRFAWLVAKHVKSNAIVLAKGGMVVGVGAGQMSRVDSVHLAVRKAGERVKGSVLASDAFFPFRDNIDEAARAGVKAIVQPGGSMRDQDSIDACNEHGLAMLFTGVRHFRH